jgi:hypothetical protein
MSQIIDISVIFLWNAFTSMGALDIIRFTGLSSSKYIPSVTENIDHSNAAVYLSMVFFNSYVYKTSYGGGGVIGGRGSSGALGSSDKEAVLV